MDIFYLLSQSFLIKVYIGDGGKETFYHNPVSIGRRYGAASRAGQSNQCAGKLILQIGCGSIFAAHAGASGTAGTPGGLFTLKTKHLI